VRPLVRLAVFAAALAAAESARAESPYPSTLEEVQAWMAAQVTDDESFTLVSWNENGVYLVDLGRLQARGDGTMRYWTRVESFDPQLRGWASTNSLYETDCVGGRYRILAQDQYPGRNLTGEPARFDLDSGWTPLTPDTIGGVLAAEVCPEATDR